jgi:hypothetical protein
MVRLYDVYCGERFCGRYVAINEPSAIDQSFNKTGGASAYSGNPKHLYKAVAV